MQPVEHLELAAWVAVNASTLVRQDRAIPTDPLNRYWWTCKSRWGRWMRAMKRLSRDDLGSGNAKRRWPTARAVLEEVLASEVPVRVWAAVVAACERRTGLREGEPVVRSVLQAHQEARCRALYLLLHLPGVPTAEAIRLNQFRRQTERWSDLFVGYLACHYDVARFAADPRRAGDFAKDFADQPAWRPGDTAWSLLMASLRQGRRADSPCSGNGDLNAQIVAAMLDCFPREYLDAATMGRSLWMHCFQGTTNQMHRLIEGLCRLEFQADERRPATLP